MENARNKSILSKAMETILKTVETTFSEEPDIYETFKKCYLNTLDTTVKKQADHTTYVITGDIPAMWLRDSTAQLRPYLIPAKEDKEIADIIAGLIKKQFQFINIDPYANAFNEAENGNCWEHDQTEMNGWIWERKYEVDSLCYPLQLAYLFWKNTKRTDPFDELFLSGAKKILSVFKTEQRHEKDSKYSFVRTTGYYTDTLSRNGKGALVRSDIGMTWSGFRPSDDACTYGYLVPSNMFAAVVLDYLKQIAKEVYQDEILAAEAQELAAKIREGIETYAIVEKSGYGKIYAYEIDGFGQYNLMDDANVPSLLAMEYMGYEGRQKEVAENTRRFILSEGNPYYYKGKKACGIGSPHTPVGYIWHIALAVQGLTETDRKKKKDLIDLLMKTNAGTGMMHEGFLAEDDTKYTREWFSWANAMFSELIMEYCGLEIMK